MDFMNSGHWMRKYFEKFLSHNYVMIAIYQFFHKKKQKIRCLTHPQNANTDQWRDIALMQTLSWIVHRQQSIVNDNNGKKDHNWKSSVAPQ